MKRALKHGLADYQRIKVLEDVKRHGVILANVCHVPIYSGIGNTVMQINQTTGLPYKD